MDKRVVAIYFLFSLVLFGCTEGQRSSGKAQNGVAGSLELWCVAKNNAEDASLQTALDWACGAGGADCRPIQKGGPCNDPSDIQNTASYAFNDYYLKHNLTEESCNFHNAAAITSLNPSFNNCRFPSSLSVSNGSFTSSTTAVGIGPSENISGSVVAAGVWFWPLLAGQIVCVIMLTMLV